MTQTRKRFRSLGKIYAFRNGLIQSTVKNTPMLWGVKVVQIRLVAPLPLVILSNVVQ